MKLKTRLSLTFALLVLVTLSLVSVFSNMSINDEFTNYIQKQQEQSVLEVVSNISAQYNDETQTWDSNFVHTIGMYALSNGYIVKIVDTYGDVLWDAEGCDMAACMQIMNNITERMTSNYPNISGEFTNKTFPLSQNGKVIGSISISYFGPYFLSENDFSFLATLNRLLFMIGISSLILALVAGHLLSKRISEPIGKTSEIAVRIASGDYAVRMDTFNNTKELDDLAGAINNLAQSLSYQEALRKQLTADVAHELRTPLTSVQTHLEAMIEGLWEITPERLSGCHEEMIRIGTLIADLENLAKVDHENIELNRTLVDVSVIISKAIGNFEMEIENKGLSVTVSGSVPEVFADEDRIHQVVVNLLSNAVKYSPHGGYINIALSRTEKFAIIAIADNGIGIPEADLPLIFERFYRVEKSRNRKTGGSGIGLAVAKAIVEAHGGKVEAESSLGSGSCFRVMIPFHKK